jgi:Protein of unknown function (DUF4058)
MPSPFPGMDPYLEQPALWAGVHTSLISILREQLVPAVGPRFFVDVQETVYILDPDDPGQRVIRPDVVVVERPVAVTPRAIPGQIAEPVMVALAEPVDLRLPFLVLRDTVDRQVVATIELLSPVNKEAGSRGRREYLDKRRRGIASTAHWIEIDLLRAGERPPEARTRNDYYAALHRAGQGDALEVWFMDLPNPLPTIAVPLLAAMPDVALDLQAAVTTLYNRFAYELTLDYATPPPPPLLMPERGAWVAELLRRWRASPANS